MSNLHPNFNCLIYAVLLFSLQRFSVWWLAIGLFFSPAFTCPTFPAGNIHSTLHAQSLSHFAFHSEAIQKSLASPFTPNTIAIVGVEWGTDLQHFASAGYRVIGVEPARKFVTHLQALVDQNPSWNVTILPFAAGNESNGTVNLQYDNGGIDEQVPIERLDDHIAEPLAVLSADIQGDELSVFQGSSRLLEANVASIWVEAIACNERVSSLLQLLDDHFVIFDFVPWGMPLSYSRKDVPKTPSSFVFNASRPSLFDDYLLWMCETRKRSYKWLQTDFLAIRRDLFDKAWPQLVVLADTQCSLPTARCLLRDIHAKIASEEMQKEEL